MKQTKDYTQAEIYLRNGANLGQIFRSTGITGSAVSHHFKGVTFPTPPRKDAPPIEYVRVTRIVNAGGDECAACIEHGIPLNQYATWARLKSGFPVLRAWLANHDSNYTELGEEIGATPHKLAMYLRGATRNRSEIEAGLTKRTGLAPEQLRLGWGISMTLAPAGDASKEAAEARGLKVGSKVVFLDDETRGTATVARLYDNYFLCHYGGGNICFLYSQIPMGEVKVR